MAKVLVALSGGVDSSMAAILLKQQGHELIGVTFDVFNNTTRNQNNKKGIKDASIIASKLDIPYYVIDVREEFEKKVIGYFVNEYSSGRTPNPCAFCNYQIKWKKLIEVADSFDCQHVATGHYAKVNQLNGRFYISEPLDSSKDQSYFLWRLSQDYLKRTIFPLGGYTKKEIKQLAKLNGVSKIAKKRESYNICFIPDGNYKRFLSSQLEMTKGEIVLKNGEKIGEHNGVWNYTIGQKKGIKSNKIDQLAVLEVDNEQNKVIVGHKEELGKKTISITEIQYSKYGQVDQNMQLKAKIDYRGGLLDCKIEISNQELKLYFEEPVYTFAPGQSVVLFEGKDMVAGGIIIK